MQDQLDQRTYTHPVTGRVYKVEVFADDYLGPPDQIHDGHGVVVRPQDYTSTPSEENEMREALYRPLWNNVRYDFIGSVQKAIDEWGVSPEKAEEAVEQDYQYLRGYYRDEWRWCYIVATLVEDESFSNSVGGFESTILDDQKQYDEFVSDIVLDIEHQIHKTVHEHQLPLFA
jgi:hypothetical protein